MFGNLFHCLGFYADLSPKYTLLHRVKKGKATFGGRGNEELKCLIEFGSKSIVSFLVVQNPFYALFTPMCF